MDSRLLLLVLLAALLFGGCIGEQAQVVPGNETLGTNPPPESHFPPSPTLTLPSGTEAPAQK